jgi:hypothetical protein
MRLPEEEDRLFWKELSDYEEEKKMPYVTSVERIGYQRGMEEGQASILSTIIAQKFGTNQDKILSVIQHLNSEELTELGKMLFDFDTSSALFDWVRHRIGQKREQ